MTDTLFREADNMTGVHLVVMKIISKYKGENVATYNPVAVDRSF